MKTESTLYFDGQFWVSVIERHEADHVRAVRIVFGAQPSDAEFYEFLLAHANALLSHLDEAAWASDMAQRRATHDNPKRAQRQASRLARRALPSTAHHRARVRMKGPTCISSDPRADAYGHGRSRSG